MTQIVENSEQRIPKIPNGCIPLILTGAGVGTIAILRTLSQGDIPPEDFVQISEGDNEGGYHLRVLNPEDPEEDTPIFNLESFPHHLAVSPDFGKAAYTYYGEFGKIEPHTIVIQSIKKHELFGKEVRLEGARIPQFISDKIKRFPI